MFNYMIQKNFALSEFFCTNQGLLYECELIADFTIILRNIILHKGDNNVKLLRVSENILKVAEFLQEFRNRWNLPIKITSGFRTNELNEKVGGAVNSKHLFGLAVDITFNGYTTYKKPIKYFGTPTRINIMCDELISAKNSGRLSELIFHDNYIHLAL